MKKVNVALLGLGTVGTGVWKMISSNQDIIAQRTGRLFDIRTILVQNRNKKRSIEGIQDRLTDRFTVVMEQDVDVVIEAMGGLEPAFSYLKQAIARGCHIVTANKELIARHGVELESLAAKKGVQVLFEASVGGGIPILGTLQHFLKANRVHKVTGIVNGTTNYILTQMEEGERDFAEVLAEAQDKGYAEADPTADVEGWDAAHKIAIVSRLVFGTYVNVDDIPRKGISDVTLSELKLANQLGYKLKLLAQTEQLSENGPVTCKVCPTLLPHEHPLAGISGVYNAVQVEGDHVLDVTLVGQGAGEKPTASAIVEDMTNIDRLTSVYAGSKESVLFVPQSHLAGQHIFALVHNDQPVNDVELRAVVNAVEKAGVTVLNWAVHTSEQKTSLALLLHDVDEEWQEALQQLDQGHWKLAHTRPVQSSDEVAHKRSERESVIS